jgi:uncharacterized protein YbaA (DUF1428 family)
MSYITGFVLAVPTARKEAYVAMAREASEMFREFGAIEMFEGWGDDIKDGKVTDFKRAVQAKEDETVVFSWIVWPDKATSQEAERKMETDERMKNMPEMPFDGKRMIFGGFTPVFEMGR